MEKWKVRSSWESYGLCSSCFSGCYRDLKVWSVVGIAESSGKVEGNVWFVW